jgi:LysR family transcriptional activator of nhaA
VRHLNYSHLLYFWTVAREGSIARAAEVLHLTPQTISGQLKLLEASVGEPLFNRAGRGLVLSETGRIVKQYADEIFALGAELTQRVKRKELGAPVALNVGIVNSIPKLIAYRVLEPALELDDPLRIVCREGDLDALLGDLAVHRLDLVLSDRPIATGLNVRAYNHPLGSSTVSMFAHRRIARRYAKAFPASLDGAPVLLPRETTALRRALDEWFDRHDVTPMVVAEFDDSALMKAFGEAASGIFPAPDAIASEVEQMYDARQIGTVDGVSESFYAISPERKLKHPAVLRITESARQRFLV